MPLDREPEVIQLIRVDSRRRFAHHIDGAGGFGEGDYLADATLAGHQGVDAVVAEGDAAVRRSAIFQGIEEKTKAFAYLFCAQAQNLEYPALNILAMNTN